MKLLILSKYTKQYDDTIYRFFNIDKFYTIIVKIIPYSPKLKDSQFFTLATCCENRIPKNINKRPSEESNKKCIMYLKKKLYIHKTNSSLRFTIII